MFGGKVDGPEISAVGSLELPVECNTRPDSSTGRYPVQLPIYVLIMVGIIALSALQGVIFPKLLSPTSYGYFAIVTTVASYGAFLQLGILNGLNRELPVRLGAADFVTTSRLVGGGTVVIATLLVGALMLYWPLILAFGGQDPKRQAALILGGGLAASGSLAQLVVLRLRAEQRALAFSTVLFAIKGFILVLGAAACVVLDFLGAALAMMAVEVIAFFYVTRYLLLPAQYMPVDWRQIGALIWIGFPLMVAAALGGVNATLDRVFLMSMVSAEDLGLYHFAALPVMLGLAISSIVNQYLSPKLLYQYGRDGSLHQVFLTSAGVSLAVALILLAAWPLFVAAMGYVVRVWLPAYEPSLALMAWFYLAAVFLSASSVGVTINAANRQRLFVLTTSLVTAFLLVAYALLARVHAELEWYAYVTVTGFGMSTSLHFLLAWLCVRRERIVEAGRQPSWA